MYVERDRAHWKRKDNLVGVCDKERENRELESERESERDRERVSIYMCKI